MAVKINTFVLKGFDKDQTQLLNTTIEYLSNIQEIDNSVSIVENLNLKLSQEDFLIIMIDELSLGQLTQNSSNRDFFLKKEHRNNQVLLILDDISIYNLPEYLQYFQTFSILSYSNYNIDESEKTGKDQSNIFEVINDIVQHLKRIKLTLPKKGLSIYIGPSDDNTTLEYQKLTRELLHRNYNILPPISNPSAKELLENKEYFINMLQSTDLAIHFIGHKSLLNYPEKSSAALKVNDIAAKFCTSDDGNMLQRIIYVPSEKYETNEILNKKILHFKSDTKNLLNAELVQTPIEKFKEVVLQKLNELEKPFSEISKVDNTIDDLYLIYPPGEEMGIKPYTEWLEKNNIKYSRSQIELDQLELLNYHQLKLTTCNAVAIYNNGNTEWLSRKLSDIKKSPGWGRKKSFKLKAIFGLNPEILSEQNDSSFILINDKNQLDNGSIKTLLIN